MHLCRGLSIDGSCSRSSHVQPPARAQSCSSNGSTLGRGLAFENVAERNCPYRRLSAIARTELCQNVLYVSLHRMRGDDELLTDLSVCATACDALEHFDLA